MNRFVLLAFVLSALPVTALAGGPTTPPPDPVVVTPVPIATRPDGNWTGFYAGAQLGYGNIASNGAGLSGNDALGGAHVGYRFDLGRTVLGGELDYNFANIDLGAADNTLDAVTRLKLMAGADLGRALVYVTVGGAYAEATLGGASASDDGYFAGVGLDYQLSDQWTAGGGAAGSSVRRFRRLGGRSGGCNPAGPRRLSVLIWADRGRDAPVLRKSLLANWRGLAMTGP